MGRVAYWFGVSLVVAAVPGCSPEGAACTGGALNCHCADGDMCFSGLVCQSGTCIDPAGTMDGGTSHHDAGPRPDSGPIVIPPGPDAGGSTAYCGPDGGMTVMATTCTGDPVPGCPCDTVGATDTCLNGRTITCEPHGEFYTWSSCTGSCFSSGTWHLDNTSPCFLLDGSGNITDAFSSWFESDGVTLSCGGPYTAGEPVPVPTEDWSANQLTVDCQGQFTLCYTIKAGDPDAPSDSDCVVGQACTSAFYAEPNVTQDLPPLGPWLSDDVSCAQQFADSGGYGEMTVVGVTIDCQQLGAMDHPFVFNRTPYCPSCCSDSSCTDGFDCAACSTGGSGGF